MKEKLVHVAVVLSVLVLTSQCVVVSSWTPEPVEEPARVVVQESYRAGGGLLEGLVERSRFESARVSSYDPTGGNADAWPIQPGETKTLADIEGAGMITHIWVTINSQAEYHLRELVLRAYWDNEETPSIECPIGDFFGLGHGMYYQYACLPLQIGTNRGLNCFWKMPFSDGARLTITNEGDLPVFSFYFYVDYRKYVRLPGQLLRFHAQYRQEMPCKPGGNYVLLEARGAGQYVGCNLSIEQNTDGWWGEGDDMIYIDGATEPQLKGTGSEDYFCGAWGYGEPFSNLYFGCPIRGPGREGDHWNVYRYHIEDPITFEESIRVTIEHGHANDRADNFSSVSYWYQTEPHSPFPELPAVTDRLIRLGRVFREEGAVDVEDYLPFFVPVGGTLAKQDMAEFEGDWSGGAQMLFKAEGADASFSVTVPDEDSATTTPTATLVVYYTQGPDYGIVQLASDGQPVGDPFDGYADTVKRAEPVSFSVPRTGSGKVEWRVIGKNDKSSGHNVGIDCVKTGQGEQ